MRCPYCVSEIHDEALVCPACQRDLYLFKPLLQRIGVLEERLNAQEQWLKQLELVVRSGAADEDDAATSAPALLEDEPVSCPAPAMILLGWVAPLALLLAAHGVITFVYDLNTLFLRIVSLLIPLPFGLLLVARERRPAWLLALMAVSLSLVGVLAMSGMTAIVDGTPVLPAGLREWREFAEYAASISFSYATGLIVGQIARTRTRTHARQSAGMSLALAHLVSAGTARTEQIQVAAKKFHDLGSSLTAAATTAAAIFTGLQGVVGK